MAGAVVFATSAAVLILEILAARLLAPYVGVTLETYTAIIGTVLAGIALGNAAGGRAADRVDPRRLLGPLLVAGGALSLATIPLVRFVGATGEDAGSKQTILLAAVGFFLPAAVLSAVTPTVAKLRLHSLATTGSTVGSLSAIGTVGALVGTFLAGFVLVEAFATSTSIVAVGALLVVAGLVLWLWLARVEPPLAAVLLVVAVGGGVTSVAGAAECHVETTYHCARVESDGGTGASCASTPSATAGSTSTTRPTSSSTTSSASPTSSPPPSPATDPSRRSTSAAAGSRCPGTSPPPDRAPAARCWRSTAASSTSAGTASA